MIREEAGGGPFCSFEVEKTTNDLSLSLSEAVLVVLTPGLGVITPAITTTIGIMASRTRSFSKRVEAQRLPKKAKETTDRFS